MAPYILSGILCVYKPTNLKIDLKNINYSLSKAGIFTVAAELKPMPHLR